MSYDVICAPVAGADVDGFQFRRNELWTIIAQCVFCRRIGFTVRRETV